MMPVGHEKEDDSAVVLKRVQRNVHERAAGDSEEAAMSEVCNSN